MPVIVELSSEHYNLFHTMFRESPLADPNDMFHRPDWFKIWFRELTNGEWYSDDYMGETFQQATFKTTEEAAVFKLTYL